MDEILHLMIGGEVLRKESVWKDGLWKDGVWESDGMSVVWKILYASAVFGDGR